MNTAPPRFHWIIAALALLAGAAALTTTGGPGSPDSNVDDPAEAAAPLTPGAWRRDAAWNQGKAEWALYDSTRVIYGAPRRHETTIFTNRQHMDPGSGVKAEDWRDPDAVSVFKHNISSIVPTENYAYRFLTTSFVHAGSSRVFKLAMSSQEDCGSTYKQFRVKGESVDIQEFCYFPGDEPRRVTNRTSEDVQFHDALSLMLRDFPFDDPKSIDLLLFENMTDTHRSKLDPASATVSYEGRERLQLPYGDVDAHHLRVTHDECGGTRFTDFWFAASPALRHVMVRYRGPWGVEMELKRLDWWAYWADPKPE